MKSILRTLYLIIIGLSVAADALAFAPETYTASSALSRGRWVRIKVKTGGMHCIPASTLADWGFADPSRVSVHGYGGAMISDVLSPENYIDDLPRAASRLTSRGLVFYAVGPEQVNLDAEGSLTHAVNPYSSYGYYYLTESDSPVPAPERGGTALASTDGCVTSVKAMSYYDPQEVSVGNTGRMMVGEDFKQKNPRQMRLYMPGLVAPENVTLRTSIVVHSVSLSPGVRISVNGTQLPAASGDVVASTANDSGVYGSVSTVSKTFTAGGEEANISISLTNTGNLRLGYLNYVELIYRRALAGSMEFLSSSPSLAAAAAGSAGRYVWDVTDPAAHYELNVGATGAWRNERAGVRRYVAWGENDNMPVPEHDGSVPAQNLHGITAIPDMVIIAPDAYIKPATVIADLHRNYENEKLTVEVVRLDHILNEFGSGAFDPGAIRRFLKMLYDRGNAEGANPLRYALLIGKGTFDNRRLTAVGRSMRSPMPLWTSENSLSESSSYSTDDYFGLLTDYDGTRPSTEDLDIAVGRIPATSENEATIVAEKIRRYLYTMPKGAWRNHMTILADDENNGDHMNQSEALVNGLSAGPSGSRMIVDKVYCDAYLRQNSTYPGAKSDLFRNFNDGMSIFAFIGHGSPNALGSKNIIQPLDFRDRFYLRRLPFFYAATCSFLKWDTDITSQAEALMFQRDGGIIGCISALRPVYISANGDLSASFGLALGGYDAVGKVPAVGELYRLAKNGVRDTNKLRYVMMGDPALRLAFPSDRVTLDAINGSAVSSAEPFTIKARQELTLTGRITDPSGRLLSDFNGTVTATFYDADYSTVSHGYGKGEEVPFEQHGDLLFVAGGQATAGEYTIKVRMPQNIADNYRPATMSLYAQATGTGDLREAAGICRDLYAFGYDETTPDDNEAPIIHHMTLNSDDFESGDDVNPSPLLIARLSDNSGLNMSTAGVGQRMSLTIDGGTTFTDLASYFTPDMTPFAGNASGTLSYPVAEMREGVHSLRLRVWDIDGNFTDRQIECNVSAALAPEIYEVFTDAMPARTEARFYVRHNRPDQIVKVTVSVYDLMGRRVWSGDAEARSDMETSSPLVWDLRNEGGQRVPRGIYVYRAELTSATSKAASASKKLAVANE
ncbi:MAG: type IX secretion system sortase PorU [Muribaculaceae bacterium]|nr:type IX secretion system sortase PorU [Muribaculaceae bacterium]